MQLTLPDGFFIDLLSTVAFGLVAILLVVLGYKVFDKLTPRLDFDTLLNQGNMAMAIVIGTFILGLCYVVAHVVSAILGG
jgi:putative membrane protein